jgi:hypothetical protein
MYKSPIRDHTLEKLIQIGGESLQSEIHKLTDSIWNKEELPDQWTECVIVPIYKKDRLCDLVVRVLGYRSGGPGSIPGTVRKKCGEVWNRVHSAS